MTTEYSKLKTKSSLRGNRKQFAGLVAIIGVLMFAGCGTFSSRVGEKPFGAYPYAAVYADTCYARRALHTDIDSQKMTENDWIAGPFIVVGDAALDTVLLPVDLLFWLFGVHKEGFRM